MFEKYPDVLNVNQVCDALGCGRNATYELLKNGSIKALRIGKIWRIPKAYLIQYIENAA